MTYLKQKSRDGVVTLGEPAFDWQHLHQVIPQRYGQNRHCCHIEHRVELYELADDWYPRKIQVVAVWIWLTWESSRLIFTTVGQATESIPSQLALNEQENRADNIRNQEHFRQGALGSDRVNDTRYGVMIDENEDGIAKYSGQVT